LMCLVSSLLFHLLTYNLGLSASFCLSARHPRGRGDPPYSECVARCYCYVDVLLLGCSMLLPIAASTCPNATSGVCG
ncbi:hypothetical protein ABMY33_22045, partial [Vibrio vulnificus]|uniref:hypothetical protein n=1 Tax=Vibrio vulnificus TaxID=672 RepID=UPI004058C053